MLNPIEKGFRNVLDHMHTYWREAEQNPYRVLQEAFGSVTPGHARSHFRSMREAMAAM
jgi:hypothetical protein